MIVCKMNGKPKIIIAFETEIIVLNDQPGYSDISTYYIDYPTSISDIRLSKNE